jgi:molybdate transport system substrate-binding protein
MSRMTPARAAVGSLVALVLLSPAASWHGRDAAGPTTRPLVVYCAASARPVAEAVARDFEAETGRRVVFRFGASEELLSQAERVSPTAPADLFLPADDSYIRMARERGIATESVPLAVMWCVVLTAPGNPEGIAHWADLLRPDVRVAVPRTAAAVGKLARDHLAATGRWDELRPRVVDTGTVTEAANAAKLGSVAAAVVWDAVAAAYPGQPVLALPELAPVTARVDVALLAQSPDPAAARRFARYLGASDRGLVRFREAGFRTVEGAPQWEVGP